MEITEEIQALLDAQAKEINEKRDEAEASLKQNRDDLLAEKKQVADEKQAALDLAEKQRLKKAAAEDDYKTISEAQAEEKIESQARITALESTIEAMETEKANNSIDKLAQAFVNEYALDDVFVKESLAEQYKKRINYHEGKSIVLDAAGNATELTIEDLTKEFVSTSKYAGHIKGTQASSGKQENADRVSEKKNLNQRTNNYLATTKP